MASTSPLQFMQQVRAEVAKIVWPTRREVVITTIMVSSWRRRRRCSSRWWTGFIRFGLQNDLHQLLRQRRARGKMRPSICFPLKVAVGGCNWPQSQTKYARRFGPRVVFCSVRIG